MSLYTRFANLFRTGNVQREIDDELQSHLAEAIEQGRNPDEARRAFGSTLRHRESSRDARVIAWLDSLRADIVFGWRQLRKNKVSSAAAILSLALAIGACTAAFRLIDALLLRPLPIKDAARLFVVAREGIDPGGKYRIGESSEYPLFQMMREAVKGEAEMIAVSYADRADVTYGSDQEIEKVTRQYVSGSMFPSFGLRPAAGRVFTANDDLKHGAHPYAVLSYDYWTRRFAKDPKVVGRSVRIGKDLLEIVGVCEEGFTGTETGAGIDIFVPAMMHAGVPHSDWSWFRPLAHLKPDVAVELITDKLRVPYQAFQEERARGFTNLPQSFKDRFLSQKLILQPASAGVSNMQRDYRIAMMALAVLVALVLLIACANVANLLTAQAAARSREMALRVSIGAGRWRLVQLILVECAWIAVLAACLGTAFAWWAAPFIVGMINPPDNPARLALPADWRVTAFGLALALAVTVLFGLAPALRTSGIKPVSALKGGEDPHARRRLMHALVAVQVAFCFLVHFVAGLFVATFERLSTQPTGFSAERLLVLDTVTSQPQTLAAWSQVAAHLRALPGVESVATTRSALLSGNFWNGFIALNGGPPGSELVRFLAVSPGWLSTMKIPLLHGRNLRDGETHPGPALVNDVLVKQYFNGVNPVGKTFERATDTQRTRYQIVGVVAAARDGNMREPLGPVALFPFDSVDRKGQPERKDRGTFLVRTVAADPMALASTLRREVARAAPGFRVANLRTQQELIDSHTLRERMLALLSLFFAMVALLLAGVGLYGVLDYSVLQRRREIGIRLAIGAQPGDIARRITVDVFSMVLIGAFAGLTLGLVSERYVETLLYGVKTTDLRMLVLPVIVIGAASLLASLPAIVRAIRIDPLKSLRAE